MCSEAAHPEDNHIIWRSTDQRTDTRTVQTVSLDSYVESRGIVPPLVLKVDTQGAEWEVWMGMRRVIESGPLTMMVEFTPWAFEGRSQPTQFLRELAAQHYIIDINPKNMAGA